MAKSATRSHSPLPAKPSISSPASARTVGSQRAVPRTLKKGCRTCRYLVCSGGSAATGTIGIGLPSESNARLEEKSSGCRSTYEADSASVTT
jgi:hypothetical protein